MSDRWPSGMTKTDLLTLSETDRRTIVNSLQLTLAHTRRSQAACVKHREYAFKFNKPADEAHYKAQHEAYQRGINRLQRLMEIFK